MKKELYVVGLIPEPVKDYIFEYQKKLSDLYGLYDKKYPELHVTLARLNYENPAQVIQFSNSLGNILSTIQPEAVNIQGINCFDPPFKSASLHVTTTPGLKDLSNLITNSAEQFGLSCQYPFGTWQYHITVASPIFARREWSESEYTEACKLLESAQICTSFVLEQIQLWYPIMEDYTISAFTLKRNK